MNIYADVTKELKTEEFKELDMYLKKDQWKTSLFGGITPRTPFRTPFWTAFIITYNKI